jgi:hypothetical protein
MATDRNRIKYIEIGAHSTFLSPHLSVHPQQSAGDIYVKKCTLCVMYVYMYRYWSTSVWVPAELQTYGRDAGAVGKWCFAGCITPRCTLHGPLRLVRTHTGDSSPCFNVSRHPDFFRPREIQSPPENSLNGSTAAFAARALIAIASFYMRRRQQVLLTDCFSSRKCFLCDLLGRCKWRLG